MSALADDLLERWTSHMPTRIRFGPGSVDCVGEVGRELGSRALVVTGRSALVTGLFERCRTLLEERGVAIEGYHEIRRDPRVDQVDAIVARARAGRADMIIAAGGGSALDASKAAAVVVRGRASAGDHLLGRAALPRESLPVVAIPTTAGTGAELSRGAILSWPERRLKRGLRGDSLRPHTAVVDPELTLTLPPDETRVTGFDAFAHAVETYVSRRASGLTAALSRDAVIGVCRHLPRALEDPSDRAARRALSFHSMLMGHNLAHSTTCLPHRLQYAVATEVSAPHGRGLAALYPAWLERTLPASPERFRDVAAWMAEGLELSRATDAPAALAAFLDRIDLQPTLSDLGLGRAACEIVAERVEGDLSPDPWWRPDRDPRDLLLAALAPEPTGGDLPWGR